MKKLFTALLFFLGFTCFSQPLLLEEWYEQYDIDSTKWEFYKKINYTYDIDNQLIEKLAGWNLEEWDYNSEGLNSEYRSQRWNSDSSLWENTELLQKKYNEDGCKERVFHTSDYFYGEKIDSFFYYDSNCQPKKHISYINKWGSSFEPDTKIEYENTGNPLTEKYQTFEYTLAPRQFWLQTEVEKTYNENGQILSELVYNNIGELRKIFSYEYDENDNLIKYKKEWYSFNQGFFRTSEADSIIIQYNNLNQITQLKCFKFNSLFDAFLLVSSEKRSYFCDGLLKLTDIEYFGGFYRHLKIHYKYNQQTNCQEKNPTELTIFPNPANAKITIKSPLLSQEGTIIRLINSSGLVFSERQTEIRTNRFEMDISEFPRGIYFIELMNDLNRTTQKLIIN